MTIMAAILSQTIFNFLSAITFLERIIEMKKKRLCRIFIMLIVFNGKSIVLIKKKKWKFMYFYASASLMDKILFITFACILFKKFEFKLNFFQFQFLFNTKIKRKK